MALATRSKPKSFHKKRLAGHHRRSKLYLKAYHPYLPVLAIVVMGVLVNKVWNSSDKTAANISTASSTARVDLVTGNSSTTTLYVILGITAVAFAIFVAIHWYRVKRVLNRGEKFAVEHPWVDVTLAFIVTAGVLLTRP